MRTDRERDNRRARQAAHRTDVAQIDRGATRAQLARRGPCGDEVPTRDLDIAGDQDLVARRGGERGRVIPDPDHDEGGVRIVALFRLGDRRTQSSDQPELADRRDGRARGPAPGALAAHAAPPIRASMRRRSARVAASGSALAQTAEITAIPCVPAPSSRSTSASVIASDRDQREAARRARSSSRDPRPRRVPRRASSPVREDGTAAEVVGPLRATRRCASSIDPAEAPMIRCGPRSRRASRSGKIVPPEVDAVRVDRDRDVDPVIDQEAARRIRLQTLARASPRGCNHLPRRAALPAVLDRVGPAANRPFRRARRDRSGTGSIVSVRMCKRPMSMRRPSAGGVSSSGTRNDRWGRCRGRSRDRDGSPRSHSASSERRRLEVEARGRSRSRSPPSRCNRCRACSSCRSAPPGNGVTPAGRDEVVGALHLVEVSALDQDRAAAALENPQARLPRVLLAA